MPVKVNQFDLAYRAKLMSQINGKIKMAFCNIIRNSPYIYTETNDKNMLQVVKFYNEIL